MFCLHLLIASVWLWIEMSEVSALTEAEVVQRHSYRPKARQAKVLSTMFPAFQFLFRFYCSFCHPTPIDHDITSLDLSFCISIKKKKARILSSSGILSYSQCCDLPRVNKGRKSLSSQTALSFLIVHVAQLHLAVFYVPARWPWTSSQGVLPQHKYQMLTLTLFRFLIPWFVLHGFLLLLAHIQQSTVSNEQPCCFSYQAYTHIQVNKHTPSHICCLLF